MLRSFHILDLSYSVAQFCSMLHLETMFSIWGIWELHTIIDFFLIWELRDCCVFWFGSGSGPVGSHSSVELHCVQTNRLQQGALLQGGEIWISDLLLHRRQQRWYDQVRNIYGCMCINLAHLLHSKHFLYIIVSIN